MLLVMCGAYAFAASDPPTDLFEDNWYRVELILFTRDMPASPQENISSTGPRSFPVRTLAFDDDGQRPYFYDLDPATYVDVPLAEIDPELAARPLTPMTLAHEGDAIPDAEPTEVAPSPSADEAVVAPPPTQEEIFAAAVEAFERNLRATSYRWLPAGVLVMTAQARRLNATGTHHVLMHGAFELPVPPRNAPLPLLVQAGHRHAGQWTIEGTLAVTIGRYLHLHARLWQQSAEQPGAYYTLDEHRRMRSGELHYLDHPVFGLLVRIDPVAAPESLLALAPSSND